MTEENDKLIGQVAQGNALGAVQVMGGADDALMRVNHLLYGPMSPGDDSALDGLMAGYADHATGGEGADSVLAAYNIGCIKLAQEDIYEAKMRFGEVLRVQPENLLARHNLGLAHELLADIDEAKTEYSRVLAQNPDSVITRINLSQIKLQEADYEGALADLEGLYNNDSSNPGLLYHYAKALLTRASSSDIQRVVDLIEAHPDGESLGPLQECRGFAYFLLGDMETAEGVFTALLGREEGNLYALMGMIKINAAKPNFDAILDFARRFQAISPNEKIGQLLEAYQESEF